MEGDKKKKRESKRRMESRSKARDKLFRGLFEKRFLEFHKNSLFVTSRKTQTGVWWFLKGIRVTDY